MFALRSHAALASRRLLSTSTSARSAQSIAPYLLVGAGAALGAAALAASAVVGSRAEAAAAAPTLAAADASAECARPLARIIGMHEGITPAQAEAVSRILLADFKAISWDGDAVRRGCFTEALIPFIKRAHAAGTVETTVLPRCRHDQDGTWTPGTELPAGTVPRAVPLQAAAIADARELLDEVLAPDWREGYVGDMEHYMALAIANRTLMRPDAVIWVLDEARPADRYHAWACLGEFRSYGALDCPTPLIVVGGDGRVLTPAELRAKPWFAATDEKLSWTEAVRLIT